MKIIDSTNDKLILYNNQKIFIVWKGQFTKAVKTGNGSHIIGWHSFILDNGMEERIPMKLGDTYGTGILDYIIDCGMTYIL